MQLPAIRLGRFSSDNNISIYVNVVKPYYHIGHWTIKYMEGERLKDIIDGQAIQISSEQGASFSLKDMANLLKETSITYERFKDIVGGKLYFEANYEPDQVYITIDVGLEAFENGARYARENARSHTFAFNTENREINYTRFIREFDYAGRVITALTSEPDIVYDNSNPIIQIGSLAHGTSISLTCVWTEVEAYILREQSSDTITIIYTSLNSAIRDLQSDDKLVIVKENFVISSTIEFPCDVTIVASNAITFTRSPSFVSDECYMFVISKNVVFTSEGHIGATFTFDGGSILSARGVFYVKANGTLTLDNSVTIQNSLLNLDDSNTKGGAIYSTGTLVLNGANLINNRAYLGGGVYATGNVTIQDWTTLSGNTANKGGAIYIAGSAVLDMSGASTIIANNSALYGAGIYFASSKTGSIINATFANNYYSYGVATTYGGAIYVAESKGITITSATFASNKATYGGAIYVERSQLADNILTIDDCSFETNEATYGGAICSGKPSDIVGAKQQVVIESLVSNNDKADFGSTIAVMSGNVTILDITARNGAKLDGSNGYYLYIYGVSTSKEDNTPKSVVTMLGGRLENAYVCTNAILNVGKDFEIGQINLVTDRALDFISVLDPITKTNNTITIIVPITNGIDIYGKVVKPTTPTISNITNYPASGEIVPVVKFISTLLPSDEYFEVENGLLNTYRMKTIAQSVVITDAKYTLTLDFAGGSAQSSNVDYVETAIGGVLDVKYGDSVSDIVNNIELTQDNKHFLGWFYLDGEQETQITNQTMPRNDLDVYAKFSDIFHVLTLDLNDSDSLLGIKTTIGILPEGYVVDGSTIQIEVHEEDVATTFGAQVLQVLGRSLTRRGYLLSGFGISQVGAPAYDVMGSSTSGDTYFRMPNKALTLYVIWTPSTYHIEYNANSLDSTGTIANSKTQNFDSYVTLSSSQYSRIGYTQVGWSLLQEIISEDDIIPLGSSVLFDDVTGGTICLYAVWQVNQYAINFDSNGKDTNEHLPSIVAEYGLDANFPTNHYTTTGYTQVGWSLTRDGSSGIITKDETFIIDNTTSGYISEGALTFYAIWQANVYDLTIINPFNAETIVLRLGYTEQYVLSNTNILSQDNNFVSLFTSVAGYTEDIYTDLNDPSYLDYKTADVQYGVDEVVTINDNITLYAVVEPYYINVYSDEDSEDFVRVDMNPDNADGEVYIYKEDLTALQKYGYELSGILHAGSFAGNARIAIRADSNKTHQDYVASWIGKEYKLRYHNGETISESGKVRAGNSIVLSAGNNDIKAWSFMQGEHQSVDAQKSEEITLTSELLTYINELQNLADSASDGIIINVYPISAYLCRVVYNFNNVDENTTYNIVDRDGNVVSASSTQGQEFDVSETYITIDDCSYEIVGVIKNDGSVDYTSADAKYAYFAGWITQEGILLSPQEKIGLDQEYSFVGTLSLYAVWEFYTNPLAFSFTGNMIDGFTSYASTIITDNAEVILPRHSVVYDGNKISSGAEITTISFGSSEPNKTIASRINSLDFKLMYNQINVVDKCFEYCNNLESIFNFPQSGSIGHGALAAKKLTQITFAGDGSKYRLQSNVLFEDGNLHTYLVSNSEDAIDYRFVGSAGVEVLPYAFYKAKLKTLDVSASLTANSLAGISFAVNSKLIINELNVPLSTLCGGVLNNLSCVVVTSGNEVIENAFSGWTGLQEVLYLNSVSTIGNNAFNGCSSLTTFGKESGKTNLSSITSYGVSCFEGTALGGRLILSDAQDLTTPITIASRAFARIPATFVEITNRNISDINTEAFAGSKISSARVYTTQALNAVINGSEIKKNDASCVIYTIVSVYAITQSEDLDTTKYQGYNFVVEDLVQVFDASGSLVDNYSSIQEAVDSESTKAGYVVMLKWHVVVSEMVTIKKSVTIVAGRDVSAIAPSSINITRGDSYAGNLFNICNHVTFGGISAIDRYTILPLNFTSNRTDIADESMFIVDGSYEVGKLMGGATLSFVGTNKDVTITFSNLVAQQGAVATISHGQVLFDNVILKDNNAVCGGVVFVGENGKATFTACTITGNHAIYGGVACVGLVNDVGVSNAAVYFDTFTSQIENNYAQMGGVLFLNTTLDDEKSASYIKNATMTKNYVGDKLNSLKGETYGGTIYIKSGKFVVSDAIISNSSAECGGAIYVEAGTLVLNDGSQITGNNAVNGGGVYVAQEGSTVMKLASETIDNPTKAKITSNTATSGGGIYLASEVSSTISSGEISGNIATNGGGVYVAGNVDITPENQIYTIVLTSNDAVISGNTATYGGGLFVSGGAISIDDNATIIGNTAIFGGGVYITNVDHSGSLVTQRIVKLNGGSIVSNIAEQKDDNGGYGGGVYVDNGTLYIGGNSHIGSSDKGNVSEIGGGIYVAGGEVYSDNKLTEENASYIAYNISDLGGGVYITGGEVKFRANLNIISNIATNGGGIYATTTLSSPRKLNLNLYSTCVSDNIAEVGGGLYIAKAHSDNRTEVELDSPIFNKNIAALGGNIYVDDESTLTINDGQIVDVNLADNLPEGIDVKYAGIYLDNYSPQALTIGNDVKIDSIFLPSSFVDGERVQAIVNINADEIGLENGTQIKLYLGEPKSEEEDRVKIARYNNDGAYAYAGKFWSERAVFTCEGADVYITNSTTYVPDPTGDISKYQYYANIKDAVDLYNGTEYTIVLQKDQAVNKTIFVGNDKKINIIGEDGSNYVIYRNQPDEHIYTGTMFEVQKGSSLTFNGKNGDETLPSITIYGGKLTSGSMPATITDDDYVDAESMIIMSGEVVINANVTLCGNKSENGGSVYVNEDGTLKLYGGFISNNKANNGGAIYIEGTAEIHSGQVSDNTAENGGAIYVVSGSLTVDSNNGANVIQLTNNTAENGGGAIYVQSGSVELKSVSDISNNTSTSNGSAGGAIYVEGGSISIQSSTFENNSAQDKGGHIYVNSTDNGNIISGGSFTDGDAQYGGAIYVDGKLTINNATIKENGSAISTLGGGVFVGESANLTIADSTLSQNNAVDGAGLYVCGSTTLSNVEVSTNTATGNGGGVFVGESANLTITNSTLSQNNAVDGAGLYVCGTTTLSGVTILKNEASHNGGGIYRTSGQLVMNTININSEPIETIVSENSATRNGGGLYLEDRTNDKLHKVIITAEITKNTSIDVGAGVYVGNSSEDTTGAAVQLVGATITYNGNGSRDGDGLYLKSGRVEILGDTSGASTTIIRDNGSGDRLASVVLDYEDDYKGNYFGNLSENLVGNGLYISSSIDYQKDGGQIENAFDALSLLHKSTTFMAGVKATADATSESGEPVQQAIISRTSSSSKVNIKCVFSGDDYKDNNDSVVMFNNSKTEVSRNDYLTFFKLMPAENGDEKTLNLVDATAGNSQLVVSPQLFKEIQMKASAGEVPVGQVRASYSDLQYAVDHMLDGNMLLVNIEGFIDNNGREYTQGVYALEDTLVLGGVGTNAQAHNIIIAGLSTFDDTNTSIITWALKGNASKPLIDIGNGYTLILGFDENNPRYDYLTPEEKTQINEALLLGKEEGTSISTIRISGDKDNAFGYGMSVAKQAINVQGSLYLEAYSEITDINMITAGGTQPDAPITISNTGKVYVNGGAIKNNNGRSGGKGIISVAGGGEVTLTAGEISDNSSDKGGVVYLHGGANLNIQGAIAINNNCSFVGGVVYMDEGSTANIQGGKFNNNKAMATGNTSRATAGGVFYVNKANLEISGGTFEGNQAQINRGKGGLGGVIYAQLSNEKGSVTISGGSFNKSSAVYGGTIYTVYSSNNENHILNITGGEVYNSSSTKDGGAVYIKGVSQTIGEGSSAITTYSLVSLSSFTIDGKYESESSYGATQNGGGIYAENARLDIESCKIQNCNAESGGGIYLTNSQLYANTIVDESHNPTTISGNTSTANGGGIYVDKDSSIYLGNVSNDSDNTIMLASNSANVGGGIYLAHEGIRVAHATIYSIKMQGNTSSDSNNSSGIYVASVGDSFVFDNGQEDKTSASLSGKILIGDTLFLSYVNDAVSNVKLNGTFSSHFIDNRIKVVLQNESGGQCAHNDYFNIIAKYPQGLKYNVDDRIFEGKNEDYVFVLNRDDDNTYYIMIGERNVAKVYEEYTDNSKEETRTVTAYYMNIESAFRELVVDNANENIVDRKVTIYLLKDFTIPYNPSFDKEGNSAGVIKDGYEDNNLIGLIVDFTSGDYNPTSGNVSQKTDGKWTISRIVDSGANARTNVSEQKAQYEISHGVTLNISNLIFTDHSSFTINTPYFLVTNGEVTFDDVNFKDINKPYTNGSVIFIAGEDAKVTLTYSTIKSSYGGNGIINITSGELSISGCTISGNSVTNGTLYISGGSVTISGTTFVSNTASSNGGAICYNSSTATLTFGSNVVIGQSGVNKANTANFGGGIYINNTSVGTEETEALKIIIPTGVTIAYNNATNGGGVYVEAGEVQINTNKISYNTAQYNTEEKDGDLVITDGDGGGVYVAGGVVTFDNATISNNNAYNGAGLYIAGGSVTIGNTTFALNIASNNGGAICYDSSTAALKFNSNVVIGSSEAGNTANLGGGVYIHNTSGDAITIPTGVSIAYNNATDGGGVYVAGGKVDLGQSATRTISTEDLVVHSNIASNNGGGVYVAGGSTLTIANDNVTIGVYEELSDEEHPENPPTINYYSNASTNGGGVYVENGATFTMSAGKITGNKSVDGTIIDNGGGIYSIGTTTIAGGEISHNTATNGGGIYVAGGTTSLQGGTIAQNTATNGGGTYVAGGTTSLQGGTIAQNTATNGGGVYVENGATLAMSQGNITGNIANCGGGIYTKGGIKITGGEISSNSAHQGGGLYYNATSSVESPIKNVTIANNNVYATHNGSAVQHSQGGGLFVNNGKINLSSVTIQCNNAYAGEGGGMYICGGETKVNVTGTTQFVSNTTTDTSNNSTFAEGDQTYSSHAGGAMYLSQGALTLGTESKTTSITFDGNSSNMGGAVYIHDDSTLAHVGIVTYTQNTATSGGAIYYAGGTLRDTSPTEDSFSSAFSAETSFANNHATNGGALYINNASKEVTIKSDTEFKGNYATKGTSGSIEPSDTTQSPPSPEEQGGNGGTFFVKQGNLTLQGITIGTGTTTPDWDNQTERGGVIYAEQGVVTLGGTTINASTAKFGGAVYITGNAKLSVGAFNGKNSEFNYNRADEKGGAIYIDTQEIGSVISNATFTSNATSRNANISRLGGAIYVETWDDESYGIDNLGTEDEKYVLNKTSDKDDLPKEGCRYLQINKVTFDSNHSRDGGSLYVTSQLIGENDYHKGSVIIQDSNFMTGKIYSEAPNSGSSSKPEIGNAENGGAIYLNDGYLFIKGSTIGAKNNGFKATKAGGAIYQTYHSASILKLCADCDINNCHATSGGGIYSQGGEIIINSDASIHDCTATNGGGMYLNGSVKLNSNGNIYKNIANANGGGIYMNTVTGNQNVGNVYDNTATNDGGGLYLDSCNNATISGNIGRERRGNSSDQDGAGVYIENGTVTFNSSIQFNSAIGKGGGLYIYRATVSLASCSVSNNESENGAGVYLEGYKSIINSNPDITLATLTMSAKSSIKGNTASGNGGGVYIYKYSLVNMTGGEISNNTAGYNGGGVYLADEGTMWVNYTNGRDSDFNAVYSSSHEAFKEVSSTILTLKGGAIYNNTATNGIVVNYGDRYGAKVNKIPHTRQVPIYEDIPVEEPIYDTTTTFAETQTLSRADYDSDEEFEMAISKVRSRMKGSWGNENLSNATISGDVVTITSTRTDEYDTGRTRTHYESVVVGYETQTYYTYEYTYDASSKTTFEAKCHDVFSLGMVMIKGGQIGSDQDIKSDSSIGWEKKTALYTKYFTYSSGTIWGSVWGTCRSESSLEDKTADKYYGDYGRQVGSFNANWVAGVTTQKTQTGKINAPYVNNYSWNYLQLWYRAAQGSSWPGIYEVHYDGLIIHIHWVIGPYDLTDFSTSRTSGKSGIIVSVDGLKEHAQGNAFWDINTWYKGYDLFNKEDMYMGMFYLYGKRYSSDGNWSRDFGSDFSGTWDIVITKDKWQQLYSTYFAQGSFSFADLYNKKVNNSIPLALLQCTGLDFTSEEDSYKTIMSMVNKAANTIILAVGAGISIVATPIVGGAVAGVLKLAWNAARDRIIPHIRDAYKKSWYEVQPLYDTLNL